MDSSPRSPVRSLTCLNLFREHQAQHGASLWDIHVDDLIPSRNFRRVHYGEA
jgi:acetolactate synthase I/II/III large subunit